MKSSRSVALTILMLALAFLSLPSSLFAYEEQIDAIATRLAQRLEAQPGKTIAVVDFTDVRGNKTELGRFLAEELSVALLSTGKGFRMVDRAHLSRIMEESRLGESGVVDPATAKELGRVAGVDLLVTGTLTALGDSVRLTVKVLDTETANILAGERETLPDSPAIRELLARGLTGTRSAHVSQGPSTTYTQSYDIQSREAGGLVATARAVRLLKEGRAALLLRIENRNPYDVSVGPPDEDDRDGTLVDNGGNQLSLQRGICNDIAFNTRPCRSLHECTHIESGGSQELTLVFYPGRGEASKLGSRFTAGLRLRVCRSAEDQGRAVQFSFSDLPADSIGGNE